MKSLQRTLLLLLATNLLTVGSVFAWCFVGLGTSCKVQEITNTATNQLKVGNVTSETKTVIGDTTTTIGETVQTVNADIIKQFIGSQNAETLFVPLTSASTKQIQSTEKIYNDLKQVVTEINKSNQELLVKQAEENRKFIIEVLARPPNFNINNGGSPPIPFNITSAETTPVYIKTVSDQQSSLITALQGVANAITNRPNANQDLTPLINALQSGFQGLASSTSTTTDYSAVLDITNQLLQNLASSTQSIASSTITNSMFNQSASQVISQTASFTAEWGKTYSIAAAADLTVTLPTAVGNNGKDITLIRTDSTAFVVTIDGNAAETINGQATLVLANGYSTNTLRSDGANVFCTQGATNVAGEYVAPVVMTGTVIGAGNSNSTNAITITGSTLSIPSAGVWEIGWSVTGNTAILTTNGNSYVQTGLYDNTGTLVPNTETQVTGEGATAANNTYVAGTGSKSTIVTTTGATTYNMKAWNAQAAAGSNITSNASGRSTIWAKKIAGLLPVSGQTVASFASNKPGFSGLSVVNTTSIDWATLQPSTARINLMGTSVLAQNGITVSNPAAGQSVINILTSGVYELNASIGMASNSVPNFVGMQWVKNGTTPIGGAASFNDPTAQGTQGSLSSPIVATLNAGDTIDIRISNNATTGTGWASHAVTVKQLGTTALAGNLGITNGGTNSAATPTAGAVAYGTGTAYDFTAAGTTGQYLKSNGTGAPAWSGTTRAVVICRNKTAQTFATGAMVVLTNWTEITDTTNSFTPTTGVFVAPRTSAYLVSVKWQINSPVVTPAGSDVGMRIRVNGAEVSMTQYSFPVAGTASIAVHQQVTAIVNLNAGDTVDSAGTQNMTASQNDNPVALSTQFYIQEINPTF